MTKRANKINHRPLEGGITGGSRSAAPHLRRW
jgi:hypothetical protein